MTIDKQIKYGKLVPVMLCFFAMGFVDLVGIASNYVKADLNLSDSEANIFPSLVFFWFLIFSVPTGVLMNRIGRKRTVMLSLLVTFVSLLLPLFGDSYGIMSFLAPYIAMWGATQAIPEFGMGWRVLFPIYMAIAVIAILWLCATPIEEEAPDKASGFSSCLKLLGSPFILLCFIGIMCHVGIDVGTNTTAPKILMERLGMPLDEAGFATSLYFIFRTLGCLSGAVILQKVASKPFLGISVVCMLVAMVLLFVSNDLTVIYIAIALIGFGNSNVFSIVFSQALLAVPDKKNEISGLMIMGLFGGTVFPLLMGFASDAVGQSGAVAVMTAGVLYLIIYMFKLKK